MDKEINRETNKETNKVVNAENTYVSFSDFRKVIIAVFLVAGCLICALVWFVGVDFSVKIVLWIATVILAVLGAFASIKAVAKKDFETVSKNEAAPVVNQVAAVNPSGKRKIKSSSEVVVLCVDDTALNLKLVSGIFAKTDMTLHTAISGQKALEMASETEYDLILMDHMMPGMDGVQTFNALRADKDSINNQTPVVMLTANAVEDAEEQYIAHGFAGYIGKPVKKDKVFEKITQILGVSIKVKEKVSDAKQKREEKLAESSSSSEAKSGIIDNPDAIIKKLDFLNTSEGLRNCNDEEELYIQVISDYFENKKTKEMETFFEKEEWSNYEIVVHSIKSTSKTIGCEDLFQEAKALEEACKEKNIEYIKEHHKLCLTDYIQLLEMLDKVLHGKDISDSNADLDDLSKYMIYVVDDDEMNRVIVSNILKDHFNVDSFESGEKLLEGMEKKVPNLVVLDIMMDGMNGFEVVEKMKQNERWKEIPVIFLTSESDSESEIKGFRTGAMDFLKKPVIAEIMLERVNRIIELFQLRKYLESEITRKSGKVERLSLQALQTLAHTIDAKDKYTNGHSNRVATYSKEISRRLGYSQEDQQTIYYMGLLHDIGKIGVPDTIINKDGRLTDEEFGMIKKHPEIGYSILKNITEIPDIEKGARWHHERFDGRGYPDGLSGEDIPFFARIIAVADSYDAMTSNRSYRDVLPQDYVAGEIEKGKGTQFDPKVASIMLDMISEDTNYDMREKKKINKEVNGTDN